MKSYMIKVNEEEYGRITAACAKLCCKRSYYLRLLLILAMEDFDKLVRPGLYFHIPQEELALSAGPLRTLQMYIPDCFQLYSEKIRRYADISRLSETQVVQCFIGSALRKDLIGVENEAL